ncbi:MAG: L,D-transpeptidase [Lactobacillus sp.]|nr:L,D-transpeptidase [Lactobacillus sp.]
MKKGVLNGIIIAVVCVLACVVIAKFSIPNSEVSQSSTKTVKVKKKEHKKSEAELARPYKDPSDLRAEGSWTKSSEKKPYPKLTSKKGLELRVSLKGNRVYLLKNGKVIYTMLSTGGMYHKGKSYTPTGTYEIRASKGDNFFNQGLNEGANNWVSWDPDDASVYLFHSVPTKADGSYDKVEAKKLGKTQGSHGCIRLSVPDSKWLMGNIPVGTKVVIKDK